MGRNTKRTNTLESMEEERRLCFVAITRAEKRLFLSEAEGWNHDGSPRYPSRFILDIDHTLLEYTAPLKENLIADARSYIDISYKYLPENEGDFVIPVGSRVRHTAFGEGTVLDIDRDRGAHIVQFDEFETPRAISFKAKLEKA